MGEHWVRVWQCAFCQEKQAEETPFVGVKIKPKILYFDIETALMQFTAFSLSVPSKRISSHSIVKDSYTLCWAAGWLDIENLEYQYIMSNGVRQAESLACDDKRIMSELWQLMNSADYIVGHNSDKFDIKKANWRFAIHGLGLPFESKQVDTLKLSKKYFAPPSHSLDYIGKHATGDGKDPHASWDEIARTGDPVELLKMELYCRADVRKGIEVLKWQLKHVEQSGKVVFK